MVRSRSLVGDEQAATLERRAVEIRQKQALKEIQAVLRAHPHLSLDIVQYIRGLGLQATDSTGTKSKPSLVTEGQAARKTALKRKQDEIASEIHAEFQDMDPKELVPPDALTFSALKLSMLQTHVLARLEPNALSVANVRNAYGKGHGGAIKTTCLNLLQMATGLDPDTPIVGKMRIWENLWDFLAKLNKERGRRLADETLPIDFETRGLYDILVTADGIAIRHRFTGETRSLSSSLPPGAHWKDMELLYNFSDTRAALASKTSLFAPLQFGQLFTMSPAPLLPALPAPAQRLALSSGSAGASPTVARSSSSASSGAGGPLEMQAVEKLPALEDGIANEKGEEHPNPEMPALDLMQTPKTKKPCVSPSPSPSAQAPPLGDAAEQPKPSHAQSDSEPPADADSQIEQGAVVLGDGGNSVAASSLPGHGEDYDDTFDVPPEK